MITITKQSKQKNPTSFAQFFIPSSFFSISEDALKKTIFLSQLSDPLHSLLMYNKRGPEWYCFKRYNIPFASLSLCPRKVFYWGSDYFHHTKRHFSPLGLTLSTSLLRKLFDTIICSLLLHPLMKVAALVIITFKYCSNAGPNGQIPQLSSEINSFQIYTNSILKLTFTFHLY